MTIASNSRSILVLEDDRSLNFLLTEELQRKGYSVRGVFTLSEAATVATEHIPDLMLVDMQLPDGDGFQVIDRFGSVCPIILMTAYGDMAQALKAVRSGAVDYLRKPVNFDSLEIAIERVLSTQELKRDVLYWRAQATRAVRETVIGDSAPMRQMRDLIKLYAKTDTPVLIQGESGVGKELVARAIHEASVRAGARFVRVDCDPSEDGSFAADLFGVESGGDNEGHEGLIEFADKGTLFLSDLSEMPIAQQSRLLRLLEIGAYRRIGGRRELGIDLRVIAASSRDLAAMVEEGTFRSELYYRLSAFQIDVPPLRERSEDIAEIAHYLLANRAFQKALPKSLAPMSIRALVRYEWPGNLRELRNVIERGIMMSGESPFIEPQHIALGKAGVRSKHGGDTEAVNFDFDHEPTLDEIRDKYLALLLERHQGNRQRVASVLGISERNTYRLIKKLDRV